jgi:hypothetical protein
MPQKTDKQTERKEKTMGRPEKWKLSDDELKGVAGGAWFV